jgi:uncharacterized membrane-anchored protein
MAPVKDHALRYALSGELHARPFPSLTASSSAAYLALKQLGENGTRDRAADLAHLTQLLDHYGAQRPDAEATHYYGEMGKYWLKWEQHTEFVTYTVFMDELGEKPFDATEFDVFPDYWLENAPGERVTSALLRLIPKPAKDADIADHLNEWFVSESLAVAEVLDGAAVIASDFRIDPAGHMRMAVFCDPKTGKRRLGRILQRLCEIEMYKTASMLGFAQARAMTPQMNALDHKLNDLMTKMRGTDAAPEETLHELLDTSVALETLAAENAYRFGATGAYAAIVSQRIEALRETRFMGRQGFGEFMMRRYEPAMRTVTSTEKRLAALSGRALRASDLLRTRVDVERSAQNQAILASMDKRADLQLRLQNTVEGLSIVAISYYAVSLAGYALYPLTEITGLSKEMLTAIAVVPVVLAVWWAVRSIRRRME